MTSPAVDRQGGAMRAWIRLFRPTHWTKNAFVIIPLLFSGRATDASAALAVLAAFGAFCLAASAVYALNDVLDSSADRSHPVKRTRPVASGQIGAPAATSASLLLAVLAVSLALVAGPATAGWIAGYLALNVAYSFVLKHMVLLDVFAIAAFFVLRLLAGSAAAHVHPSVWLLLCGGLLALYLGFAKRRHELSVLGDASAAHRGVLAHYSAPFLDQISAVLLAVTVVSYLMYTLTSPTAQLVGTEALSYGAPFVLYGLFRYLYLVHQRDLGTPTETVLSDRALIATVMLWGLYNAWVLYRPH